MKSHKVVRMGDYRQSSPMDVYLQTLSLSGRRSMEHHLQRCVKRIAPKARAATFDWSGLKYEDLVKVRYQMMEEHKSIHTVNTALSALKGVVKAAFNMGLIDADKMLRTTAVKSVKGQTLPRGRSLSNEELQKLRAACRGKSATDKRNRAIIYLLIETGMRRDEAVGLNIEDYDSASRVIRIREGKGHRQRVANLSARCCGALDQWLRQNQNSQSLFVRIRKGPQVTSERLTNYGIYSVFKKVVGDAGIMDCTPHDLRRTFVTRQLEQGQDLASVSRKMGHADLGTTAVYDRR